MKMTILNAKERLHEMWMELTKNGTDEETMQALSIAETVLGNYNDSLENDIVAMLTEVQLEIDDEAWTRECLDGSDERIVEMESVNKIIQQKIHVIKGDQDVERAYDEYINVLNMHNLDATSIEKDVDEKEGS